LGHRVGGVARVDLDRIGEVADPDATFGELVDEVEGVSHGAAEAIEGVHDDHVAVAGVLQRRLEAGAVGGGSRLLVQVDPLRRDPGLVQGVDLPVQVLLGVETRAYPSSTGGPYRRFCSYGWSGAVLRD
jgi:hypothetical protein